MKEKKYSERVDKDASEYDVRRNTKKILYAIRIHYKLVIILSLPYKEKSDQDDTRSIRPDNKLKAFAEAKKSCAIIHLL